MDGLSRQRRNDPLTIWEWPTIFERTRLFVYIEKVLDCWVQLMKNGGKNKIINATPTPQTSYCAPHFPFSPLLDFERESETDKTVHIRKRLQRQLLHAITDCTLPILTPLPSKHNVIFIFQNFCMRMKYEACDVWNKYLLLIIVRNLQSTHNFIHFMQTIYIF